MYGHIVSESILRPETSLHSMEHNYTDVYLQKSMILPYLLHLFSRTRLQYCDLFEGIPRLYLAILAGASSALSNYFYPRKKSEPVKTLNNGTGTGLKEAQGDYKGLARI